MEFEVKHGEHKEVSVKINIADFISSMKLKKAVVEAVKESGIDISSVDIGNLKAEAISSMVEAVLSVDSSDKVEDAIFKCLARCTYGGEKITRGVFEPVEVRENYYEIIFACLKVNLAPFFAPLFSKFTELQEKIIPKSPEQK